MSNREIHEFRKYLETIDASYEEWRMLIGFMVNEAAQEYMHREMLKESTYAI